MNFLNFRGDQRPKTSLRTQIAESPGTTIGDSSRYTSTAKPQIFHILWNNKFELFDRTLLMLYYKSLGKKLVLTAHNVNMRKRDCRDTWLNRFSLKIQYQLVVPYFRSYAEMKDELVSDFGIRIGKLLLFLLGLIIHARLRRSRPAKPSSSGYD